ASVAKLTEKHLRDIFSVRSALMAICAEELAELGSIKIQANLDEGTAKLDAIVGRYHEVKMRILRQLRTFGEITPQQLNDPAGEIGYRLVFYPATHALGRQLAEALEAEGINAWRRGENARPDWHIYSDMFPITLKTGDPLKGWSAGLV
ncbi:MAG TPA: hypothetical protein PKE45_20670, partial [Caldilineaceae bacterium]|nr:hypothetical protein [Caldilineaceae bacterium]